MTIADNLDPPPLALPPRPARPLSSLQFLRVAQHNSLAACDSELFDELIVERRLFGRRLFIVSDPDGIRRVLRDNHENFPRLASARRVFEFHSGTGMLAAEGDVWACVTAACSGSFLTTGRSGPTCRFRSTWRSS